MSEPHRGIVFELLIGYIFKFKFKFKFKSCHEEPKERVELVLTFYATKVNSLDGEKRIVNAIPQLPRLKSLPRV